jgi:15,16-dihydrobiliverdin:ferredoxin oxidoreductase
MYFSLFYLFNFVKFTQNPEFKFNDNYLFDKISKLHLKILNESNFEEMYVKLDFRNKESKINNGVIQNYYFKNNYFRKVRLSYFKSDNVQTFSSIWYPSYDYDIPILTLDLVNLGNDKSILFLNLIEMYNNDVYHIKYIHPLLEIKKNYTKFNINYKNLSIFLMNNSKYLSKSLLYGNLNKIETDNLLSEILEKYYTKYLNYFLKKPIDRYYIENKHIEYNNVRKKYESNFLIKKYFDNDWYDRLMTEYYK